MECIKDKEMPFLLQDYGSLGNQPDPLAKNKLKYWIKRIS